MTLVYNKIYILYVKYDTIRNFKINYINDFYTFDKST